ncbi:MAG: phage portal protein [Bacteroidales bacterium]|nr:phage portal protein [Bacteroidales bacterium]
MSIFTRGKDIKAMEARIKDIEKKGYLAPDDNEANEYLKRLLQFAANTIDFGDFNRQDLYEAYRTSSAVYGIIDRIANAVAECGKYIELLDENGKAIESHWILDLLAHPNDRYTRSRFLYAWDTNYDVFGDAFVYFDRAAVGSKMGQIRGMYIPAGNRVLIEKGGVVLPIRGIGITGAVNDQPVPNDAYFQSFRYNLDDDTFFGFSPLIAAAYDAALLKKGKERLNTAIANGGVNAIITPAKDKDGFVVPQVAAEVEKEVNKVENANKTKFFRQAIDVHNIGSTPVDLSILDSSKEAVTALCFAYGIPMDLYYGQSKYENAKQAKKALYESAALPRIRIFCEDFMDYLRRNAKALRLKDADLRLRLEVNTDKIDVLQDDPKDVLQNLTLMHASLNELREAYGYDALEGAANPGGIYDKPMLNVGTMFGDEFGGDINENEPTE